MAGQAVNRTVLNIVDIASTASTGDKGTIFVPFKCRVIRAQCLVSGTEATALVVKFDHQPTAGSATGRGDGDIGDITFTAANNQGKVFYDDAALGTLLDEGDAVVVQVTTASTGDKNVAAMLVVEPIPEVPGNNSAMVETA